MDPVAARHERSRRLQGHLTPAGADSALKTLEAIAALTAALGKPPTYRELAEERGLTQGSIQDHVSALRATGLLMPATGSSRDFMLAGFGVATSEWFDAAHEFVPRQDLGDDPDEALRKLMVVVHNALLKVDVSGDVEIIIRHRP